MKYEDLCVELVCAWLAAVGPVMPDVDPGRRTEQLKQVCLYDRQTMTELCAQGYAARQGAVQFARMVLRDIVGAKAP